MAKLKVTDLVTEMVTPILEEHELDLVDVELKKEGANWFLRVYIDKPSGYVDLDDCSVVSEALSAKLDATDPIPNAYFLEVSSAGAERPLKRPEDFTKAIGKRVYVSFYEPWNGRKSVEGILMEYGDGLLVINEDNEPVRVPVEKVAGARLAITWS